MGRYYELESIKFKVLTSEINVIETFIDEYGDPMNDFFRLPELAIRLDLGLESSIYDRLNRMVNKGILNKKLELNDDKTKEIYYYGLTDKGKKIARAFLKESGL